MSWLERNLYSLKKKKKKTFKMCTEILKEDDEKRKKKKRKKKKFQDAINLIQIRKNSIFYERMGKKKIIRNHRSL